MLEILLLIAVFLTAVYICWNCTVSSSTLILSILLGMIICFLAFPGRETFQATVITNKVLKDAGLYRPSVFNCADKIGVAPEFGSIFATKNDM